MTIIEQIEFNGMCAKIKPHEHAFWGLMRENLGARKYLRLQYRDQVCVIQKLQEYVILRNQMLNLTLQNQHDDL